MLFLCKKPTKVMKKQNVNVKGLPFLELEFKISVSKMHPPCEEHHPETSYFCVGKAHVLYQSLRKLEIK